jgi:hypothetical protein
MPIQTVLKISTGSREPNGSLLLLSKMWEKLSRFKIDEREDPESQGAQTQESAKRLESVSRSARLEGTDRTACTGDREFYQLRDSARRTGEKGAAMTKTGAKKKRPLVIGALDFFVAGVPAHGYFEMQVAGLRKLVRPSRGLSGLNQTAEVCLIALSAYFEAFCKAEFAAVINICPTILRNFVERRKDAKLDLHNVLAMLGQMESKLGNLLSEGYDFGSAKDINALYSDLLRITPFSQDEKKKYQRFLSDRNLLVHHGGVYTFEYAAQRFTERTAPGMPHWSSLVVNKQHHERWAIFLLAMAQKIAATSREALEKFVESEGIVLTPEQKRAVKFLGYDE